MTEAKALAPPAHTVVNGNKERTNQATIWQAIPRITGEVAPIAKAKTNPQQGYKFRGIDDVYAALNLLLAKHGVSILPKVLESQHDTFTTAKGSVMFRHRIRVQYKLVAADGSFDFAESEGEGMDSGDKATPKAFSTAYKTMAFEVFCIPTGEKNDTEEDSPEVDAAGAPETTAAETDKLRKEMQAAATVEKREEVAIKIHKAREEKKITEKQAVSLRPDYLAKLKELGPTKTQVTQATEAVA